MACPVCNSPLATANACPKCGYQSAGTPAQGTKTTKRSWYRINLLVHVLWLAVPLYFYGRLLNSDAYRGSLEIARSSAEIQKVLGHGIHVNGFPVGSALRQYGEDFAEWSVTL